MKLFIAEFIFNNLCPSFFDPEQSYSALNQCPLGSARAMMCLPKAVNLIFNRKLLISGNKFSNHG